MKETGLTILEDERDGSIPYPLVAPSSYTMAALMPCIGYRTNSVIRQHVYMRLPWLLHRLGTRSAVSIVGANPSIDGKNLHLSTFRLF